MPSEFGIKARETDTKIFGLEKDTGVGHVHDRDVNCSTVIHQDRIDEIAGGEELPGEGASLVAEVDEDCRACPGNTIYLAISIDPGLAVKNINSYLHQFFELVDYTLIVLRPSLTPGTMFFMSAKTGTPAAILPQFIR